MVLGDAGVDYLASLKPAERRRLPRALARKGLAALVLPAGITVEPAWQRAGIALWQGEGSAPDAVLALRRLLAREQRRHLTIHGVLVSVHGIGVLITGDPGSGKSVLALDLVSRGHALIADDAVEVTREAAGVLTGCAPKLLRGMLETRGLGLVDVRALHGAKASQAVERVELVITLDAAKGGKAPRAADRLEGRRGKLKILGVSLPVLSLAARLGHNLPALVEAACLDQRLRDDGADAAAAFEQRQARAIRRSRKAAS